MGSLNVAKVERTFVLRLIHACPCNSCSKKVREHLKQIHGIGSISMDAAEGKVTITGSMVDPCTVITKLEKLKKKASLLSEEIPIENIIKEKQIILRKSEVIKGQSKVVVCKPTDNNEVHEFASSLSPDIQSKHEHKLKLKNFDKRFTCNGCKEEGFRSRYRCNRCDYDLHRDCMFPKSTFSHELFGGSIFKFNKKPIPTCGDKDCRAQVHMMSCDACGEEIHGYFYHCKAKSISLHPCCINLKSKLCIQGLTLSLKNKASSKCFWCNDKRDKGVNSCWSYVSECGNYQFHVKCIARMAHKAWKRRADEDVDDRCSVILAENLNKELVRKSKRNGWSRGARFVKIIICIARMIIGILVGDPIAFFAPIVAELLTN